MFFFAPIETWAPGYLEGEDAGFAVGGLWVAGNVFAPAGAAGDVSVTPTAVSALVVAQGSVTSSASVSVTLTGTSLTVARGSLSPGISVALTGVTTTVAAGVTTPSISTALAHWIYSR